VRTLAAMTPRGLLASVAALAASVLPTSASGHPVRTCPISVAHSPAPPALMAGSYFYSDGRLWVAFPQRRGIIHANPSDIGTDGSISWKLPWYRGVRGMLRIRGRRLDAPASSLRASVPSGYGPAGFQASAVTFPTPGCWRVTGTVGTVSLSFVLRVYRS
jgi:hypothetical protein